MSEPTQLTFEVGMGSLLSPVGKLWSGAGGSNYADCPGLDVGSLWERPDQDSGTLSLCLKR